MDADDLRRYFCRMLEEEGYLPSEALAVFGKLVRLTIEFRDDWKAKRDEIVTVDDARQATEVYLAILKTGRIPKDLNYKVEQLVRLWLKEINGKTF